MTKKDECVGLLQNYFKYDTIMLPFFIDENDDRRALIVAIKVETCTVDLYDRERDNDSKLPRRYKYN